MTISQETDYLETEKPMLRHSLAFEEQTKKEALLGDREKSSQEKEYTLNN